MKKVISVSMIFVLMFAFAACSSKEYIDVPVTDENGQTVTDENGEVVTERVKGEAASSSTDSKKADDSTQASDGQTTGGNSSSNNSSDGKDTTSGSSNADNTEKTTAKKTTEKTTAKPTTTEKTTAVKSKKRDIEVTVNLPFYNNKETELTVFYKVDGDKKYTELKTEEIILDGKSKNKTREYTIENIKGDVIIYVEFKDITISQNSVTVPAGSEDVKVEISPVTGIEIMDGGMD